MTLTLTTVAIHPELLQTAVVLASGDSVAIRPLGRGDARSLATFLAGLSEQTRRFAPFPSYDIHAAQSLCDAIARYDKLRLVVETERQIVGLLEFSMDVPESDVIRYARHGLLLSTETDCRYGLTLADAVQGRGLGTAVFPFVADVARRFGQQRIILWGGVHADNPRAIRHYVKCGFRHTGEFVNGDGKACIDMIADLSTLN